MREELGLQRKYMFRNEKSAVEGDLNKNWSVIEKEAKLKRGWAGG